MYSKHPCDFFEKPWGLLVALDPLKLKCVVKWCETTTAATAQLSLPGALHAY